MAEANANQDLDGAMSPELALEMESLRSTERGALLMLLLGEQMASEIVGYLNPKKSKHWAPPWLVSLTLVRRQWT